VGEFAYNHALLWSGTAASAVNLHPAGYDASAAYGVSGAYQVGDGFSPTSGGFSHALLWNGSAASAVDLHPAGFDSSGAAAVSGAYQVGSGILTSSGARHALVWNGTAASAVDLHPLLSSIGSYLGSHGYGIAEDGSIVGFAYDGNREYAVLWSPLADFNGNSVVDAADYVVWRKDLGTTYNDAQYDLWRSQSGNPQAVGGATDSANAAVPEPATPTFIILAVVSTLLRRDSTDMRATLFCNHTYWRTRP
jgi:hypothetical protein